MSPAGRRPFRIFASGLRETGRLVAFITVVAAGAGVAALLGVRGIYQSPAYLTGVTVLLAVGLFASTSGIPLDEARANARVVVVAVTLGVLAKAALIAGVMYAVFRRPEYLILGVAVAQIDPLSVAAIRHRTRMSRRAAAVLSAWASFDDPVTALITVYLASWLLADGVGRTTAARPGAHSILTQIALNAALAAVAYLVWRLVRGADPADPGAPGDPIGARPGTRRWGAQVGLLGATMTVAVWQFLMLGLAVVGLFFRPRLGRLLELATHTAFWTAAAALGLILAEGVRIVPGVVLGLAAFGSQVVVGTLINWRSPREDRIDLALGHQNGITAIILALLLEPWFPGTVAVVAPAIVVVNLAHTVSNAVWDRRRARTGAAPAGSPAARDALQDLVPDP
jgi:hypothetical protein